MTKIKICGLRGLKDVKAANTLHVDYAGFVFAPKSARCVTPAEAATLRAVLRPDVPAVGVFVNEGIENVEALLRSGIIQIAQLHGDEDEGYIRTLSAMTGAEVWKAFRVSTAEELERAALSPADRILLDHGPGGTGESFDWTLLQGFRRPYLLAGGLSAENVLQALRLCHPWGVDVSSGVETDGVKDAEKMEAFVKAVREEESI